MKRKQKKEDTRKKPGTCHILLHARQAKKKKQEECKKTYDSVSESEDEDKSISTSN
jgi:hypothetical protein